jgi:signal peptidase I
MERKLKILLLSLLTPGLGYLQNGDRKSFYNTILLFFSVLILGASLRLLTNFWGLAVVVLSLFAIYISAAIHATKKVNTANGRTKVSGLLKACFTLAFVIITGLSFANRRTTMGFDIMSMDVPVMQPTLLEGERFLVDTWTTERGLKRGTIVVHSFIGQEGLYLNRIIGIGGDTIEIKDGSVFIKGKALSEPYVVTTNATRPQSRNIQPIVIPHGHYFVMGDNRDASFGDSRFSGVISIGNIVGRATDIISSQDKARIGTTLE